MSLIYNELIPASERPAFLKKVEEVANYLKIDPNWLMQVMKAESGLRANIVNPTGGATGLIQFMPATAIGLGTTTAALKAMTRVEQLDWVRKYYAPYRGKMNSYYDVYLVTFFPAAIGKPDNWVFQTSRLSASLIANQNPAINKWPKDDKITIGEFKKYLQSTVAPGYYAAIFNSTGGKIAGVGALIFLTAISMFFYYLNNKNF